MRISGIDAIAIDIPPQQELRAPATDDSTTGGALRA
jgi:hypothetical protein